MKEIQWHQRRLNEFTEQHSYHYAEPVSKRLHRIKYTCTSCGDLIPADEVCSPSLDGEDFICDGCYDELYRFFCPNCEDLDEKEFRDNIGSVLVVVDPEEAGVSIGVYEITGFPYYFGFSMDANNIKKLSPETYEVTPDEPYDSGQGFVLICRTCQESVLKKIQAQKLAKKWRKQYGGDSCKGGVIVICNGVAQGWVNELRDPQHWQHGCIAVGESGQEWIAVGGNDRDGAERWEQLPLDGQIG